MGDVRMHSQQDARLTTATICAQKHLIFQGVQMDRFSNYRHLEDNLKS
jgi:hypothetical protein